MPSHPSETIESEPHGDFHARLNAAAGSVSYRKLGRLTETHPETVRRYMQGQSPSAVFLTNLCRVLSISGEWLLTGRGPMKCTEMRSHALSQADPSELMTAVANTLTDLCDRMDRLERFVQTMETRIRGTSTVVKQDLGKAQITGQSTKSAPTDQSRSRPAGDHEQSAQSIEAKPAGQSKRSTNEENAVGQPDNSARTGETSAQRIRDAIANRL